MRRLSALIIVLSILLAACSHKKDVSKHPMDNLPQNEAGEVVRKAIAYAGGWKNWDQKKNFTFYKKMTYLDSAGVVSKIVRQLHEYNLGDLFQANMSWKVDGDNYRVINNGYQAKKYSDGIEFTDQQSRNQAWNSSFGSHYVIAMPYKLTDSGATLTYEGIDSTVMGKPVHAVKVTYAEGIGSSGGMHVWWYYFDRDNFGLIGNFLDHGHGYVLTTYEGFEYVDKIRIHNKRYFYESNENREKLRLVIIYENEAMQFDRELDSEIFELK